MSKDKSIQLQPEWKAYFWLLFWGVLLFPLLGIGLILIRKAYKKRSEHFYEIHDRFIQATTPNETQKLDLSTIETVEVVQRWIDKQLDVGTVELTANASSISLVGMDDPHQLAEMIRHAVQVEKVRLESRQKSEARSPNYDPGSLSKIDDLTGLWQQGLISDEDYKKERKHFEN